MSGHEIAEKKPLEDGVHSMVPREKMSDRESYQEIFKVDCLRLIFFVTLGAFFVVLGVTEPIAEEHKGHQAGTKGHKEWKLNPLAYFEKVLIEIWKTLSLFDPGRLIMIESHV